MRFAYADPPYPGQAHKYRNHPDYAGEVNHAALVAQLCADYSDGWALSTSAAALREVLILCPPDVRIAVWHNTCAEPPGGKNDRWHRVWEPVIVWRGRSARADGPTVRNLLACGAIVGTAAWNAGINHQLIGQKPPRFTRWILELLGATPDDQVDDLFPGSGAVGQEWQRWRTQPMLTMEER